MKRLVLQTPRYHLRLYQVWGGLAFMLFLVLAVFGAVNVVRTTLELPLLFAALVTGFAWIGATSLSRHAFVNTKRAIGKEATLAEFLLTQLAVPFYPFLYRRLEGEIRVFEAGSARGKNQHG